MIRRPDVPLLLSLVRGTLTGADALPPAERREALALCDGILGICARRTEHETAWMLEEIADVAGLVARLVQEGHDPDGDLRAAAGALPPLAGLEATGVPARYDACSALLARAVAPALRAGGDVKARLDAVVDRRIAHERDVRGDVRLVRD